MEAPVAKAIVTEATSAETISAEGRLMEPRSSIEAACPETRIGAHAAESVTATHVASKRASTRKSAMPSGSAPRTNVHLRRGQH
jgi:hypothetical protein